MASLRARHSRKCALKGAETSAPQREKDRIEGCTCRPSYSLRGAAGKGHERLGRDLRTALRAWGKRQVAEDEGTPVPLANVRFATWADRWLGSLECKQTTRMSYASTVAYAKEKFGLKMVRRISPADVADFSVYLRDVLKVGDSTRAKHLRVLAACLESAVMHDLAGSNPVKRIPKGEKPRARRREAPFFEDAELPKLVNELDGLWRVLVLTALKTGMREGELAALTWADVDLSEALIHVRRSVTSGHVGVPKSHEKREVELTEDVVKLLGEWWGQCDTEGGDYALEGSMERGLERGPELAAAGDARRARSGRTARARPDGARRGALTNAALVFPRFGVGGHIPDYAFTRQCLYPAMTRAGIPRKGPTGTDRTFHSLRHTYARICLEHGCAETWLQRQLGHSSLAVTTGIYGHWSKAARKLQAAKLEGAFVV